MLEELPPETSEDMRPIDGSAAGFDTVQVPGADRMPALPTTYYMPDAVQPAEGAPSYANAVTIKALGAFDNAALDHEYAHASHSRLDEQIEQLEFGLARASQQMEDARRDMHQALTDGRRELWETTNAGQDYVSGSDILANAVRLTPYDGRPESVLLRERRVRTVLDCSARIHHGVPALIARARDPGCDELTYHGCTPSHDGFNVRLHEVDGGNELLLGLNEQVIAPINEAWHVVKGVGMLESAIRPTFELYTGEMVGRYINERVAADMVEITHANSTLATHEDVHWTSAIRDERKSILMQRDAVRRDMVGVIEAAEQTNTPLALPDDMRETLVAALCDYLMDIGGSSHGMLDYNLLLKTGRAMHYVYPADAETTMIAYLIQKSNELSNQRYNRQHHVAPVVTVMQQVCGLRDWPEGLIIR